jgi:hypothetical protein
VLAWDRSRLQIGSAAYVSAGEANRTRTLREITVVNKIRKIPPVILPVSATLGMLAVSGHARKPTPLPEPTLVTVAGAIAGDGDPRAINVEFNDSLAHE